MPPGPIEDAFERHIQRRGIGINRAEYETGRALAAALDELIGPVGRRHSLPSVMCPRCGRTSWNINDVENRYCGYCHLFHDQMATDTAALPRLMHGELEYLAEAIRARMTDYPSSRGMGQALLTAVREAQYSVERAHPTGTPPGGNSG